MDEFADQKPTTPSIDDLVAKFRELSSKMTPALEELAAIQREIKRLSDQANPTTREDDEHCTK